jgi:hypothetical protein
LLGQPGLIILTESGGGRNPDLDPARPQLLRYLSLQLDRQETVLQIRPGNPHVISQVECLLEAAICEPLVQYFPVLLLSLFLTAHDQCVALLGKFDFVRSETGNGHADPVIVFADPLNVIRRPVGTTAVVQHVKQAIEANGGTEEGSKVISSQNHILLEAIWIAGAFNGTPSSQFGLDASEVILLEIVFKRPGEQFPAFRARRARFLFG